jgi:hypothetical protein
MTKALRIFVLIPALIMFSCAPGSSEDEPAAEGEYDTRALAHLDKLTEVVGEMASVSFTLNTVVSEEPKEHSVYLRGPDKIYFHSVRLETGNQTGFWFNGSVLSFYSYVDNTYASLEAPGDILEAIDFMNTEYGV